MYLYRSIQNVVVIMLVLNDLMFGVVLMHSVLIDYIFFLCCCCQLPDELNRIGVDNYGSDDVMVVVDVDDHNVD